MGVVIHPVDIEYSFKWSQWLSISGGWNNSFGDNKRQAIINTNGALRFQGISSSRDPKNWHNKCHTSIYVGLQTGHETAFPNLLLLTIWPHGLKLNNKSRI